MPHAILPGLYQGSAPSPGDGLARRGFRALVLCAKEYQPAAQLFPGVEVLHAPNDDADRAPTRDELHTAARAASWAAHRVAAGRPVLVTCMQGRNRSGLVSALAARLLTGADGAACARLVQHARPAALTNPHFVRVLLSPETVARMQLEAGIPEAARATLEGAAVGRAGAPVIGARGCVPVARPNAVPQLPILPHSPEGQAMSRAVAAAEKLAAQLGPRAWLRRVLPVARGALPMVMVSVDPLMMVTGLPFEVDGVPVRLAGLGTFGGGL